MRLITSESFLANFNIILLDSIYSMIKCHSKFEQCAKETDASYKKNILSNIRLMYTYVLYTLIYLIFPESEYYLDR